MFQLVRVPLAVCFLGLCLEITGAGRLMAQPPALQPRVVRETPVYQYTAADNGAGPMWCSGSTCLVRVPSGVFAAGLRTVPDLPPLNNCRWMLFRLGPAGWDELLHEPEGRTREPCPLAAFHDGQVWLSDNPTLHPPHVRGGGPARPALRQVVGPDGQVSHTVEHPQWEGSPAFTEHSYRTLAADGARQELILFQNIGYGHAEWSLRDAHGQWTRAGKLQWPWGAEYAQPQPIRICYPNVMLQDRRVFFCGVSDIVEPNREWREYKKQLTGQEWDYDFRRLFFTWCDDIASQPFHDWIEIASREATCGWIQPADLWVDERGSVHVLWLERALDERLRDKFFPQARQSRALNYAIVRGGQVVARTALILDEEGPGARGTVTPHFARFHVGTADRLYVLCYVTQRRADGQQLAENRILELLADGSVSPHVTLPLKLPFVSFFTATVRAGSPPSDTVDLLGQQLGQPGQIGYAQIQLQ